MKGIITQKARDGSRWFIAKGEDGIDYFIGCHSLVRPKQYNHYAFTGNTVTFDKDTSKFYRIPHGCNAVLTEVADPNKGAKRFRAAANKQRRLANEGRKRQAI